MSTTGTQRAKDTRIYALRREDIREIYRRNYENHLANPQRYRAPIDIKNIEEYVDISTDEFIRLIEEIREDVHTHA